MSVSVLRPKCSIALLRWNLGATRRNASVSHTLAWPYDHAHSQWKKTPSLPAYPVEPACTCQLSAL